MEKNNYNNNDNNENNYHDGIDYSKFLKPKKNPIVNIGDKYQADIIEPLNDKKIEKNIKDFNSFKEDILNTNSHKRIKKNIKSKSKSKSKPKQNNIKENIEIDSSIINDELLYKKRKLNNDNI